MSNLRRIPLDGCVNFRDLGGYVSTLGGTTRWGVLFRADSLHRMSEADAKIVVGELGVRTAVDLRSDHERSQVGVLDQSLPMTEHHINTTDQAMNVTTADAMAGKTVGEVYEAMLMRSGPKFVAALDILADPSGWPAAFYCMAGKDRTGCLASLVLGLVGVAPQDIVADYIATAPAVDVIRARSLREMPEMSQMWAKLPDDITKAPTHAMADLLEKVDARWGGVEEYAMAHGVSGATVDRLRSSFLV